MNTGIGFALLAAVLFGASTPFAKLLMGGQTPPLLLAGMLYLGSGIGLSLWMALRAAIKKRGHETATITATDLPWLAGAVLSGGIIGPVLLMTGLNQVPAATASLLLNMEGVLTALLAWFVFRESFDKRVFAGMLLIIAAGVLLSWDSDATSPGISWGALGIVAACLCWAVDNNLTRKVSGGDASTIACLKGLIAGSVNLGLALAAGAALPAAGTLLAAAALGFAGYGVSLALFVVALRGLGTARTGAYFSVAPFFGAALAFAVLVETPSAAFWIAAALMALGVWLHISERHEHEHAHEPMEHTHEHAHDAHHQHEHDFAWDGREPHVHPHRHERLVHSHPHYPDLHHRHHH